MREFNNSEIRGYEFDRVFIDDGLNIRIEMDSDVEKLCECAKIPTFFEGPKDEKTDKE